MPTRYSLDVAEVLSKAVQEESLDSTESKKAVRKSVKELLEKRFKDLADPKAATDKAGVGALYFFKKLRF